MARRDKAGPDKARIIMRTATIQFEGVSPYSQSKHHTEPKVGQETNDAYERRTWRHRMHSDSDGYVIIPPMSAKNGLVSAAKFLNQKIPGEGQKTFTKRFESGILSMEPVVLDTKVVDVPCQELFVPSDGVRGSGKRVIKLFGVLPEWGGSFIVHVLDEKISNKVFAEHADAWGTFIGIGRFRPERNGYYGRFKVKQIKWS